MSLFFLIFFAVYGGLHVYVFFRTWAALAFGPAFGIALALFMLLMVLSPLSIRLLERNGFELPARVLSYAAYLWMAFVFLYFCISLLLAAGNLALRGLAWAGLDKAGGLLLPGRLSFLFGSGLALAVCVYGYFSAMDIRTERMQLVTTKLPRGMERLKIVQISDVHLGLIVRCDRLERIMDIVKAEEPDIFVSTGDLVDAQINRMTGMAELLLQVKAPYGNYAITGNHEYYAGLQQALDFTRAAGFTLLRGELVLDGPIAIAGVNDPTQMQMYKGTPQSEEALLAAIPQNKFGLFLKHRPQVEPNSVGLFDLQLSGHTHRGQIYPFRYVSAMAYPMNAGRFDLGSGSVLRVSRGTGTWGPPIRFLSPPEITVIELVSAESLQKK
jgi:hypothetical protein